MLGRLVGEQLDRVRQRGADHAEAVAARANGQTFLLAQQRGKEAPHAAELPNTRLFYLIRYRLEDNKLIFAMPTDERIEALEASGALPHPVARYCDPNGGYSGPAAAADSPTCAVFDVTLAQVALPESEGLFDKSQTTTLTRVR